MTASLARRAGILLGIMLGAVLLVHTLVYLIPGDPAVMIAGDYASEQDISAIRSELSLNEPFFTRYLVYLSRLARLDMGKSIYTGAPVRALIADRFPATLGSRSSPWQWRGSPALASASSPESQGTRRQTGLSSSAPQSASRRPFS
jgi:ABC-type microcin C transport system permease subunit YejB